MMHFKLISLNGCCCFLCYIVSAWYPFINSTSAINLTRNVSAHQGVKLPGGAHRRKTTCTHKTSKSFVFVTKLFQCLHTQQQKTVEISLLPCKFKHNSAPFFTKAMNKFLNISFQTIRNTKRNLGLYYA